MLAWGTIFLVSTSMFPEVLDLRDVNHYLSSLSMATKEEDSIMPYLNILPPPELQSRIPQEGTQVLTVCNTILCNRHNWVWLIYVLKRKSEKSRKKKETSSCIPKMQVIHSSLR